MMTECGAWWIGIRRSMRVLLFCQFVVACAISKGAEAPRQYKSPAERRKGVAIVCHRGSSEFAHENTLEAYRATFELGADGNELDIRSTKDGVLVCFHDDMLDCLLEAFGDVSDYTWDELQRFRFRDPKQFGPQCRIPTLQEAFELHKRYGGLMHLDIKRPNQDRAIAQLLDRLDLWEHVAACNSDNGAVILADPRLHPCRYKASLYSDRSEVFPEAIAAALAKPGDALIVDDPRGAIVALGRKLRPVSKEAVSPREPSTLVGSAPPPGEADLVAILRDDPDWNQVAESEADQEVSARRILARARAADQLRAMRASSPAAIAALEERVRHRSLHKKWQYHGLDGAIALRALILLQAPSAPELARFTLWRDDPALDPVIDPRWKNPRPWTDFRVKMVIFPSLTHSRGKEAADLCREYLAYDEGKAKQLVPQQYQEATRALMATSPTTETALELMRHPLQGVRGRAILDCLAHAQEAWAAAALEQGARHALAYRAGD